MLEFIVKALQRYPELAIFASLAIGYWIGAIKLGSFALGSVTGTLLAAILMSELGVAVSPDVSDFSDHVTCHDDGYRVGPAVR